MSVSVEGDGGSEGATKRLHACAIGHLVGITASLVSKATETPIMFKLSENAVAVGVGGHSPKCKL